ncbi:MAG: ArsJ-associated glyceraldehyde-3-phosphate dehydrogenase [Akkermansiaceae bacterium]|nr:ArsJ-associated glyceraldehyde-3-phosphate dehydrogenase [Akkermansiaceae bacterium]MDG2322492.1 ArsJ-associated glyceraldehyde-3-phosphate dehydrogenase [Akkermansiaceae bacterium]
MKIAINGFGRIGRLVLRAAFDNPELEFVRLNDSKANAETAAHLLEFDTVHGRWDRDISSTDDTILIDGQALAYTSEDHPSKIDWAGIDIVLECSGAFRDTESLQTYLDAGVKKIIVAAPVKEGVLNIVMGCNDGLYSPATDHIITNASCTTNCIAPVIKVIHETFGLKHGMLTTLHDLTNTQTIVDAPHKDLRRARSAVNSLIPTTTGSATAVTMIFPELKGRLNGVAVRVPLLNASLTDLVLELEKEVTVDEVNTALKAAAEGPLQGILGYEEKPLVSADYTNDPRSGVIDAKSTMVVNGTQLKLLVWYDNEWGYSVRMAELTQKVASSLK